jgi:hypothetical protein
MRMEDLNSRSIPLKTVLIPKPGSVWIHSKSRQRYRVLHNALRESDGVFLVVYQSLSSSHPTVWVRPRSEWYTRFKEIIKLSI